MRDYLVRLRKHAGLTTREVARRVNISGPYYVLIETGQRQQDMRISLITRLSEVLNISADELFHMEQEYQLRQAHTA